MYALCEYFLATNAFHRVISTHLNLHTATNIILRYAATNHEFYAAICRCSDHLKNGFCA